MFRGNAYKNFLSMKFIAQICSRLSEKVAGHEYESFLSHLIVETSKESYYMEYYIAYALDIQITII